MTLISWYWDDAGNQTISFKRPKQLPHSAPAGDPRRSSHPRITDGPIASSSGQIVRVARIVVAGEHERSRGTRQKNAIA
jgi:hypothetical protein